jgi:hypothetical protein
MHLTECRMQWLCHLGLAPGNLGRSCSLGLRPRCICCLSCLCGNPRRVTLALFLAFGLVGFLAGLAGLLLLLEVVTRCFLGHLLRRGLWSLLCGRLLDRRFPVNEVVSTMCLRRQSVVDDPAIRTEYTMRVLWAEWVNAQFVIIHVPVAGNRVLSHSRVCGCAQFGGNGGIASFPLTNEFVAVRVNLFLEGIIMSFGSSELVPGRDLSVARLANLNSEWRTGRIRRTEDIDLAAVAFADTDVFLESPILDFPGFVLAVTGAVPCEFQLFETWVGGHEGHLFL